MIAAAALRGGDLERARSALAGPVADAEPRGASHEVDALRIELHLAAGEHEEAAAIARQVFRDYHGPGWRIVAEPLVATHALLAAASALRRVGALDLAARAAVSAGTVSGYTLDGGPWRGQADAAEAFGVVEANLGRYDEAIAAHGEALALRRVVVGDRHPESGTSHHHLGAAYEATARLDLARFHYERALEIRMRALGDHPLTARTYNNLGNLAYREGRWDEAIAMHTAARRIRVAAYGEDHAETATSDANLGMVELARGDAEAARRRFEHVLDVRVRVLGPDHPYTGIIHNNLGLALAALGDDEAALAEHRQALAIRRAFFGDDHLEVARSHHNLGALLLARGDLAAAREHIDAALAIRRRHLPPTHPEIESTRRLQGRLERASRPLDDEGWSP
ncbi:MAG: tetratricopeptide repeat protein [Nannocystaceae bacterium]